MGEAAHLCLTCKLAEWRKTATGRRHPSGVGKCGWKPAHIPTPAAWAWGISNNRQPAGPVWGQIERIPRAPITECETYEALK